MRRITQNKQLIVHQLQHRNSMVVWRSHIDQYDDAFSAGRDINTSPFNALHTKLGIVLEFLAVWDPNLAYPLHVYR